MFIPCFVRDCRQHPVHKCYRSSRPIFLNLYWRSSLYQSSDHSSGIENSVGLTAFFVDGRNQNTVDWMDKIYLQSLILNHTILSYNPIVYESHKMRHYSLEPANRWFFNIPDTFKSSMTTWLWFLAKKVVSLWIVSRLIFAIRRCSRWTFKKHLSQFFDPLVFRLKWRCNRPSFLAADLYALG